MSGPEDIIWDDPSRYPAPTNRRYDWFYAELEANPGRWARYPGRGRLGEKVRRRLRETGFEFTQRKVDGQTVVFVRKVLSE